MMDAEENSSTQNDNLIFDKLLAKKGYNRKFTESEVIPLLSGINKLLNSDGSDQTLRINITRFLLSSTSIFDFLILDSREITFLLAAIFQNLVDKSNLTGIKEMYSLMCGKLTENFDTLQSLNFINDYNTLKQIEQSILIISSALKPLVMIKNSLIVLRGLEPSIFCLIYCNLPLNDVSIICNFPNCHQMLICLAKNFSETHDYFATNSELLNEGQHSLFIADSPTSKYLAQILFTLTFQLNAFENMSHLCRQIFMNWIHNFSIYVDKNCNASTLQKKEFIELRTVLLTTFVDYKFKEYPEFIKPFSVVLNCFDVFALLRSNEFQFLPTVTIFISKMIASSGKFIPRDFRELWIRTPLPYMIRFSTVELDHYFTHHTQIKLHHSSFTTVHFHHLCNFLLKKNPITLSLEGKVESDWFLVFINTIYSSMISSDKEKYENFASRLCFVFSQFALFCIENRMKTPLGKTAETFTQFEEDIRKLAQLLTIKQSSDMKRSEHRLTPIRGHSKDYEIIHETNPKILDSSILSYSEEWLRVRLLLLFVDILDKLISYAINGAMIELAPIQIASRSFFRTNKDVCHSWLLRIAPPLMAVGFTNGLYSQTVRFAKTVFNDIDERHDDSIVSIQKMDLNTTLVICWCARSMVKLKVAQGVQGIYKWVKKTYDLSFDWLKGAELLAAGKIEDAIFEFSNYITEKSIDKSSMQIKHTVEEMMYEGISLLRGKSCDQISNAFVSEDEQCIQNDDMKHKEFSDKYKWNGIFALASWEQLEKQYSQYSRHSKERISPAWTSDATINDIEMQISKLATNALSSETPPYKMKPIIEEIVSMDEQLSDLAQYVLKNCMEEMDFHMHSRIALLHTVLLAIQTHVQNQCQLADLSEKTGKGQHRFKGLQPGKSYPMGFLELDLEHVLLENWRRNSVNRLQIGQFLSVWMEKLYRKHKASNSVNSIAHNYKPPHYQLSLLHRTLSRLARKSGNSYIAIQHFNYGSENFDDESQQIVNGISNNAPLQLTKHFHQGYNIYFSPTNFHRPADLNPPPIILSANEKLLQTLHLAKLRWNVNNRMNNCLSGNRISAFAQILDTVCSEIGQYSIAQTNYNFQLAQLNGFVASIIPPSLDQHVAKMCVHLANWSTEIPNAYDLIQRKQSNINREFLQQVLKEYDSISDCATDEISALQGALFLAASIYEQKLPKLHKNLADWALKQISLSTIECEEDSPLKVKMPFSEAEKSYFLRFGVDPNSSHLASLITNIDSLEEFKSNICTYVKSIEQLASFTTAEFSQIWTQIRHRQYRIYEIALNSYIRFMETSSYSNDHRHKCSRITHSATKVLSLLTSHPDWFMKVIDATWMDRINHTLWMDIIPQLFAYLNHPKMVVRQTICILLEKIGQSSPHSICYPAVVNARISDDIMSNLLSWNIRPKKSSNQESNTSDIENHPMLSNLEHKISSEISPITEYSRVLVTSLTRNYPELMRDVTDFCSNLQKISLLHEEKLLFILNMLDQEIIRKFKYLFQRRKTPSAQKQGQEMEPQYIESLMQNLLLFLQFVFEQIFSSKCESNNEKDFTTNYQNLFEDALRNLQEHIQDPVLAWESFKTIIVRLNKQAMRRSALCLNMQDISPFLYNMNSLHMPLPLEGNSSFGSQSFNPHDDQIKFAKTITVYKINRMAIILPTKTRPKKISFVGSDGKEYTFLFKGQEDLHLDERIMQLMRICNKLFIDPRNQNQMDVHPPYECNCYSVTPIGFRSGLIEWVNDAIPLFQIYRKWRIRQNTFNSESAEKHSTETETTTFKHPQEEPERPMDMYYNKLKAVFAKNNIPKTVFADRQKWPMKCLEIVFKELIDETPQDILSRELWMHSSNSASWWRSTARFARTTAVMSMIGSMIGLGDRHLDNVLVNLRSGSLIHVDYNVCFEKGRVLRVPERVPFRLTGNITHSLGPTKIEGIYRGSCEHALGVLRNNADLILSLLDAFIYDPSYAQEFTVLSSTIKASTEKFEAKNIIKQIGRKLVGHEMVLIPKNDTTLNNSVTPTSPPIYEEKTSLSPSEQVDLLIEEATSSDNLSLMYEGWTAWV